MRRFLLGLLLILIGLAAVLLANTLRLPNHQLGAVPAAPAVAVVPDSALAHLAGALRIPTVSRTRYAETDTLPFDQFQAYLQRTFPLVHQRLRLQKVNRYGLLYEWPGTNAALKPLLLLAHQDVVPVLPGTDSQWVRPPFAGQQAGGYLYGRGALDDKLNVLGQLEAVEALLRAGFRPRRTVLLAFGHDEETQGRRGAAALAALLQTQHPQLEMVLDEGGLVKADGVAGLTQPVALVGVSEKGYLTLELSATGPGGHSSMPPALTSVGRVAAAVAKLEAQPFPARLDGGVSGLLAYLAPAVPFGKRLVFANQWVFGPLIKKTLAATPSGNAALRTTTAPTIMRGGDKDNVLPDRATATVNFRLLPGDSVAAVLRRVREIIDDPQIQLRTVGEGRDATPVSGTDNAAFATLHRTIRSVFPRALVAPYVVVGATDARAYASLCPQATYRFIPVLMNQVAIESLHGTNERLRAGAYPDVIRFYAALIKNM
ncbi:M20/M25/M40 family metallo-hydrolase [Hymenobacter cheonanensis]|uniref:M20/M25/M40 family metallo-hydrolase n=1 Tax=Hymenobacter sp. CA2-7 TaxID=3063993 RepID=UPI00271363CD|nr:M20/M25/M40 family metallo-hydrolase [Hymenobacter sp. CA2-7]MDO7886881.1 M20/M25/M40 family metallo-hydrolase [Hymenobacter sp. CA2-7]